MRGAYEREKARCEELEKRLPISSKRTALKQHRPHGSNLDKIEECSHSLENPGCFPKTENSKKQEDDMLINSFQTTLDVPSGSNTSLLQTNSATIEGLTGRNQLPEDSSTIPKIKIFNAKNENNASLYSLKTSPGTVSAECNKSRPQTLNLAATSECSRSESLGDSLTNARNTASSINTFQPPSNTSSGLSSLVHRMDSLQGPPRHRMDNIQGPASRPRVDTSQKPTRIDNRSSSDIQPITSRSPNDTQPMKSRTSNSTQPITFEPTLEGPDERSKAFRKMFADSCNHREHKILRSGADLELTDLSPRDDQSKTFGEVLMDSCYKSKNQSDPITETRKHSSDNPHYGRLQADLMVFLRELITPNRKLITFNRNLFASNRTLLNPIRRTDELDITRNSYECRLPFKSMSPETMRVA